MPYAEAAIGALLLILLSAAGFFLWKWGRSKAIAAKDQAEAALKVERTVADAVDKARATPITADDLGLSDQSRRPPPG
jgi:hypothetical protein